MRKGTSFAKPLAVAFCAPALFAVLLSCASAPADGGRARASAAVLPDPAETLRAATRFYGAQRSGTLDNWLLAQYPPELRAPCFARDGESLREGLDLSGGWHDAGDFIKFTLTTAYSAHALLKSWDAFPAAHADLYGADGSSGPDGIPDVLNEAKWGLDWLLKIHLDSAALVSQIGDHTDHDVPGTCPSRADMSPVSGGEPRPVWFGDTRDDPSRVKADLLGMTAAALALAGRIYAPYDSVYARACVAHARQLYATAVDRPGTTPSPNGETFYVKRGWEDDLLCGAVELFRATGERNYLSDALEADRRLGDHGWVVDWGQHADFCRHSLAVSDSLGRLAGEGNWGRAVARYRTKVSDAPEVAGLAFFGEWGSLRYAMNAAFSSALYASVYGDSAAASFAERQWDWALGDNPYGHSFVVGVGTNPPKAPHHKNAFGERRWASPSDTSRYPLVGALVGGPHLQTYSDPWMTSPPGWRDAMNDYVGNEVSIDYNAGLVGTSAFVALRRGSSAKAGE